MYNSLWCVCVEHKINTVKIKKFCAEGIWRGGIHKFTSWKSVRNVFFHIPICSKRPHTLSFEINWTGPRRRRASRSSLAAWASSLWTAPPGSFVCRTRRRPRSASRSSRPRWPPRPKGGGSGPTPLACAQKYLVKNLGIFIWFLLFLRGKWAYEIVHIFLLCWLFSTSLGSDKFEEKKTSRSHTFYETSFCEKQWKIKAQHTQKTFVPKYLWFLFWRAARIVELSQPSASKRLQKKIITSSCKIRYRLPIQAKDIFLTYPSATSFSWVILPPSWQ